MSPPLSLLFSISFLFVAVIHSRGTALLGTSSPNCPSYTCSGVTIGYPFWRIDDMNSTTYCGYPGFSVGCRNQPNPIFCHLHHDYYVRNISYIDRTFTLVDMDLRDQQCPRPRHNLTFGDLPLYYSYQDLNLTFCFNCTTSLLSGTSLPCLENGTKGPYVFVTGNEPEGFELCEERVVTTLLRKEVDFSTFSNVFGAALARGFVLDWGVQMDCAECENSNGRCGSDKDGYKFHCFCLDGRVEGKHCGEGLKLSVKLLIGFGTSGAIMVVAALIFYSYHRQNERQYGSSYHSSRLNSSDPSSLRDLERAGVLIFAYNELAKATNCFDPDMELGDGGFATVYKGKLQDGRVVAVKRLHENNYKRVQQFVNEIEILARLRHRNLVTLYGCSARHSRELLLVYEYVPNGTLADHLHGPQARPNKPDWPTRLTIAVETASSLAYLHASEVIHRDVKSNNILLDESFHVKVADFGLSRLFPADATHVSTAPLGTPGYMDPEYYECYQVTAKSDVYSFGVVLAEIISSKPAVDITRHRHEIHLSNMALSKIQNDALHELVDSSLGYELDSTVTRSIRAVAELAFQCLQSGREMRPLMEEVLETLSTIQSEEYFDERRADGLFRPKMVHS